MEIFVEHFNSSKLSHHPRDVFVLSNTRKSVCIINDELIFCCYENDVRFLIGTIKNILVLNFQFDLEQILIQILIKYIKDY